MDNTSTSSRRKARREPFTKTALAKLPVNGTPYYVYDAGQAGLTLYVGKTGKSFYCYHKVDGKPQRNLLGSFPEMSVENARDAARAILGDKVRGIDPAAEQRRRRNVPTLKAAFEKWRDGYAKHHRKTWKDDQRQFDKYIVLNEKGTVRFHDRRLDKLTKSEVAKWLGEMEENHGPIQANRVLELLRTVINHAIAEDDNGFEGPNPARFTRKKGTGVLRAFDETERDRYLRPDEVQRFFAAVLAEPPLYRDFFMLAILTACRRGNVQAARWDQIDWTFKSWRIPETKSGKPLNVPLTEVAIALLRLRQKDTNGSPWVFPSATGPGHLIDPRKSWRRILKTSGLTDLRIHDLRRSTASWAALKGESLLVIAKMLGHESTDATRVYARLSTDPIRASLTDATGAMLATAGVEVQLIGAEQLPAPDETDDSDPTEF